MFRHNPPPAATAGNVPSASDDAADDAAAAASVAAVVVPAAAKHGSDLHDVKFVSCSSSINVDRHSRAKCSCSSGGSKPRTTNRPGRGSGRQTGDDSEEDGVQMRWG